MTRGEAIKHLEEWKECISSAYRRQVIDMAIEALQAEPKHGKWIGAFCSECGEEAITEWNETGGEMIYTSFCPNCGAKMDKE